MKHTNLPHSISRRDFLRWSANSLVGFFLSKTGWSKIPTKSASKIPSSFLVSNLADMRGISLKNPKLSSEQQGRVIYERIDIYDRPSFEGQRIKQYWKDTVLPITDVTVGDEEPDYNRVWYNLNEQGYAHSGGIQPVKTNLNLPESNIPPDGTWGEVTVPYTDVYSGMSQYESLAYRYYYETIHWVLALEYDSYGVPWYRVLDDKFKLEYFAPATHMRIIPRDELSQLSPNVPEDAKRIEVHTREQVLIAYEYDSPVFMARAATGASLREGNYKTPPGSYFVYSKRAGRHMAAGDLASNGFDLPGVPWICYIVRGGLAIHGTYWHNDFGRTRSHGCVNLTPQAARWVYRWTQPYVLPSEQQVYVYEGTRVDVITKEDENEES